MNKAQEILEEYHALFKHNGREVVIFLNPTRSEFSELGNSVRFSAYAHSKEFYAWDAERAIHVEVRRQAGLPIKGKKLVFWQNGNEMLDGVARGSGGSYVLASSDCFTQGFFEYQSALKRNNLKWARDVIHSLADVLDQDWSWVNRYIKVDAWLEEAKRDVNAALENLRDPRRVK